MQYDSFGRCISKTHLDQTTNYLFIDLQEFAEVKDENITQLKVLVPQRPGAITTIELENEPYMVQQDPSHNIIEVRDLNCRLMSDYRYTAYGEKKVLVNRQKCPWGFAGRREDTFSQLVNFGLRYYDPEIGRWISKDPAGDECGSNLYAYVHNSPLLYRDDYGFYGEPNSRRFNIFTAISNFFSSTPSVTHTHYECTMNHFTHYNRWSENYDVNEWLRSYNHTPGLYSGYDNPPIGYVNGVGTDLTAALQTGYELGYLLDTNVIVTHVPSFTVGADLLKCTMGRMGIATEAVHKIHENWTNYFTNYPDKDLFWVCHSGGAIDTRNALASYPNELCQRINVLAIAPGGFMDDHLCKSIVHIVSSMDPVPKTDPIGWARCRDNIVVLRGNGITDHYILNNMYAQDIKEYYNEFKKRSQS